MRKILPLAILLLFSFSQCSAKRYTYYGYSGILSKMSELAEEYPRYCQLFDARDEISYIIDTYCGESLCDHKYMIITDFDAPDEEINSLPQVLFLGGIHGDEVLGPNIVINLAEYLLQNIEEPDVGRLVKSRYIILLPMANPSGFHARKREEQQVDKSIDPNRDFPYDLRSGICFQTACARVIHHLYRKFLIQAAITFHGGMQAIGYPWGAMNHISRIVNGKRGAEESPDDKIFADIGKILSKEAGSNSAMHLKPYPVGRMTDIVYPVDGGMEDWAYSASWESQYSPNVISKCNKIDESIRMEPSDLSYGPQSVRSLVYLVETADSKMPAEAYLGASEGLQGNQPAYGHIPININLCLALADLLQPYVKVLAVEYDEVQNALHVKWQGGGCKTVDETFLEWTNNEGAETFKNTLKAKSGPGYYENKNFVYDETIQLNNTKFQLAFTIKMTCDQTWATQVDPRPLAKIQTHIANSRTNQSYFAESNGFTVSGSRVVEYTQNNIVAADFAKKRTVDLKDMNLEIQVVDCAYKNYGRVNMNILENGDSYLMNFEGSLSVSEKPLHAFLHQFGDLSRCKDSMGSPLNPNTFTVSTSDSTSIPLFQATEQTADGKLTVADSRTVPNEAGIQQLVGRSVHFDAPKNSEVRYVGQILPVQPASCSKDEEMSNCFGTDIGEHSAICNVNVELENNRYLVKLLIDAGVPEESITISGFVSNAVMAYYDNPKEIIIVNEKIETKLSLDQNRTTFINNYYQVIEQGTLNLNPQFALANMLRVYVDQLGGRKLVGDCSIVRRDTMFDEKAYMSRIPHTATGAKVVEAIKTNFYSWLLLGVSLAVGAFAIFYIIKKFRKEAGNVKEENSAAGFGRAVGQHIELAENPEEGTDI